MLIQNHYRAADDMLQRNRPPWISSAPRGFGRSMPSFAEWALDHRKAIVSRNCTRPLAELKAFYDAMLPRDGRDHGVSEAVSLASLSEHAAEAMNLDHLAMTFAETAHPLDLGWKDVDFPSAFPWERMEFRTVSTQF